MRRSSRRPTPLHLPALVLLLTVAGCTPTQPGGEIATLVLRGGVVATVDDTRPSAEAVAVQGDRILAVGTDDEIEAFVGNGTQVVELDGRLLMPGFIEGHGHFLSLGDAKSILDLNGAESWEQIVEQVKQAVAEAQPGEWIRGRGWHQEKWALPPKPAVQGNPVHDTLSEVSPDNPVLLGHASGHAAFANAAAMAAAGIDASTPDPPGGEIVHSADGRPTGLLRETAQRLVARVLQDSRSDMTPEERENELRRHVELAGEEALRHGVTSFHDAGVSFSTIDFYRRLEDEGALPVRLYAMVRGETNATMAAKLAQYRAVAEGNDFLTVRSIKRQIDGALGAHGAWLLDPYEDLPSSTGLVLEPVEDIEETARIALENGFQVNTHAIGDRANREVLDIYERTFLSSEDTDLRWRIEHAQHMHPSEVPRFASLGVIASMQGIHCTSDAPWVYARLGSERAETGAYLWRDLLDAGVIINNGTDVPVEPIDPIPSFYASVSRVTKDGSVFFGRQSMTREEALYSYTMSNAYAAFEEDLKGSITPGKLADMVVLSQDILTVDEADIPNTRVDLTVLGGNVVYER
ncbi:MAG: amidohydrolase [Acidobacteriota bacterium]